MRTIPSRRGMLSLLGSIVTVTVAACSAHPAGNVAGPRGRAAMTPAATAQAISPAAPTPSTTPAAAGVQNLVVTPSVLSELQAAYVAYMQFPPSDIAGTAPNSVYYAYEPATGSYWAMATFVESATASLNTTVDMQDGSNTGMFSETSGGAWQVVREGVPPGCGLLQFFPAAVIAAWALPTPICPEAPPG
jgi:hypothetical protein